MRAQTTEAFSTGHAPADAAEHAAALSDAHAGASAEAILETALSGRLGPAAAVSSFGADSAALLHMIAQVRPDAPVLLLDTLLLFPETVAYQQELSELLGLTGVRRIRPEETELADEDPDDDLRDWNADACCDLRKTRPLERALAPYAVAVTGRKRFQTGQRRAMRPFEADAAGRIRVNPLADWTGDDVRARIAAAGLPPHPLVARGFPSIGCAPCTTPVAPGEDPRAGRWRGREKVECGIHFVNGRPVRTAA